MSRILRADAPDDAREWDGLLQKLPLPLHDVHFTSAYARTQQAAGGTAMCAVETFGGGEIIMQPFMMYRIQDTNYFDIKSMYGYGGPISNVSTSPSAPNLGRAFKEGLRAWARQTGVVSEYCVLHPLFAHHQLPLVRDDNVIFTKDVVCIDNLTGFSQDMLERRVRRSIKKADATHIVIQSEAPEIFGALYDQSMDRLQAQSRWRYGLVYWFSHGKEIGARWFFTAATSGADAGRFRRGLLTIGKNLTAYAHFLGSDGDQRNAGLDELLYYRAAQHLAEEGYQRFHLGGGLTARDDDSLLFFKSGFSNTHYKVGSYQRIFQPEIYDTLTDDKAMREREFFGRESTSDWFPSYRREFA